jgi:hypothetical protein
MFLNAAEIHLDSYKNSLMFKFRDKQLNPKTQELKKGEPSEEECSPSASLNGI